MSNIVFVRTGGIYSDPRATKELMTLAGAGHCVRVITWDRSGEASGKCAAVFKEYADRISFTFYSGGPESCAKLRNISEFYSWFHFVESTLEEWAESIDWVHACNLESGWPAYQACEKLGLRLVYDIFDYFIDSHTLPPAFAELTEKMEIGVIDFADTTIICIEERTEQIEKARPRKVVVVHNSPDVACPDPDLPELYDYAYCGSFPDDRLLTEILALYKDNQDLHFVFAGTGKHKDLVEACAAAPNFEFRGRLTFAEALEIESRAGVISAIYGPTKRNHRLCAPNKFYEALALGKPLIVCRGTGIDRIVEEHDIGTVIDYDADEFYRALRALLSDKKRRSEMGARARRLYESKYAWTIQAKRLLSIYGG